VGGQADDLDAENKELGLEELEAIHRRKTGAMFRVSLRLGGRVAEADESVIAMLDSYGRDIGLAFQIVDDLLDLQGSVETLGKRTKKDADRGKLTFPTVLGVEASRSRAAELIRRAREAIQPLGSRGATLAGLAQFILDRHK
jgi:geranylgeranyl pyrophosphate synthase